MMRRLENITIDIETIS